MERLRRSESFVLDRTFLHGNVGRDYGVFSSLDVHMVKGGEMREIIIISIILILAVLIWRPRKK